MRMLLQRVSQASVTVAGEVTGTIGPGLLLLVGVTHDDSEATAAFIAAKVANLRLFPDSAASLNRSALDLLAAGDEVGLLVVSQFTLYADVRKGRRPSFLAAAPPEVASPVVDHLAAALRGFGLTVAEGRFGTHMEVALVNDGPVTIWLDSATLKGPS